MANFKQYYDTIELSKLIPFIDINANELGSTDTYNEEKLLKKYHSLEKEGQILVYKAAIQLAIVGYGNKSYGFIRKDDKNIIMLEEIFKKYNVKYNEKINIKYGDDDLSVRRIIRLFRAHVQKFINDKKRPSYLWLKYANKQNVNYMSICFPGGEHLVEKEEEALFFLDVYEKLDLSLGTKFRKRLQRVFIARNILSPNYFVDKNY
jgi:hypothetical protein